MKNFIILVFLIIAGGLFFKYFPLKKPNVATQKILKTQPSIDNLKPISVASSVFVPDWNMTDETILNNQYNRWIYFGGPEKVATFTANLKNQELWLTIKVTNTDELKAVGDKLNQLDQSDKFKGVVLDLEITGLSTQEFVDQINLGVSNAYDLVHTKNLKLAVAVYGDAFYRKRPIDLAFINNHSDEVMVMAYDFTKSYGEPGANFPFQEFKIMVDQYLKYVPARKLTIVFGMFGYDWTLQDGKPLGPASSLTLAQINKKFLGKKCAFDKCKINIDPLSKEKNITYMDINEHQVYFEDLESTGVKTDYLKEKGVGNIAYWAWGYF